MRHLRLTVLLFLLGLQASSEPNVKWPVVFADLQGRGAGLALRNRNSLALLGYHQLLSASFMSVRSPSLKPMCWNFRMTFIQQIHLRESSVMWPF